MSVRLLEFSFATLFSTLRTVEVYRYLKHFSHETERREERTDEEPK